LQVRRSKKRWQQPDLVVDLSLSRCPYEGMVMAVAVKETDELGRPTVASLGVCRKYIEGLRSLSRVDMEADVMKSLLHELIHIFGFNYESFPKFRDPQTLAPRGVRSDGKRKVVRYNCEYDRATGNPKIEWDVDTGRDSFEFLDGVFGAIDARGLKAAECRCPVDPTKTYTNEDIEHCLIAPEHCALGIVTETVVATAKRLLGSAKSHIGGMEMRIEGNRFCRLEFHRDHWAESQELTSNDVMNWRIGAGYLQVSPLTLGVLQDSGWYKVDPSILTSSQPASLIISPKKVLAQPEQYECGPDALTGLFLPDMKSYSCADYNPSVPGFAGPDSRCFMLSSPDDDMPRIASCIETRCSDDGESYALHLASEKAVCKEAGRTVDFGKFQAECQDPKVVCADWSIPYLLSGGFKAPRADLGAQY
jgi:hypothetical protein